MPDKTRIVGNLVSDNNLFSDITNDRVGIGSTVPTAKLDVSGNVNVSGIVTASSFSGTATTAISLQNSRTFEITGDIIASPVSFNGTGNVSLAATIQPNSVGLGTDTTGDYVQSISGTSNQITVTGGTGESSTPTLTIPNQFTVPQDATITRDLQVTRNLNVDGNITIGGTSATLFTTEFKVLDPDIVLGFRTDGNGNDISTDNTANHGGIAIASTEGSPLISLYDVGIGETNPATYKKIMWFKSGAFAGLNTDAWLINYAVGIGSTQFPDGTRLAAGAVQFTENDLAVVRDINASGIVTASTFSGNVVGGDASVTSLNVTGVATVSSNLTVNGNTLYVDATNNRVGILTTSPIQPLQVGTGSSVVVIDALGEVGIGTTNPTAKLQVIGNASVSGVTTTGILNVGVGGTIITTTSNGLVGIGSALPGSTLVVNAPSGYSGNILDLRHNGFQNMWLVAGQQTAADAVLWINGKNGSPAQYSSNGITYTSGAWASISMGGGTASSTNGIFMGVGGVAGFQIGSNIPFSFGNDVKLARDAANVLAQRNGTAAQTLRIYNTFTDASNYVRGKLEWSGNVFRVGTERLGTGSTANTGLDLQTDGTTRVSISTTGLVGIGTTVPTYNLHVVGSFGATTKSFIIPHPTKEGRKLQYGSLEGPELGVYVRGRSQDTSIVLPEYWTKLVDADTITVNLTPIGNSINPRVERIENNTVFVFSKEEGELDYYYTVFAERCDVDKLVVEI